MSGPGWLLTCGTLLSASLRAARAPPDLLLGHVTKPGPCSVSGASSATTRVRRTDGPAIPEDHALVTSGAGALVQRHKRRSHHGFCDDQVSTTRPRAQLCRGRIPGPPGRDHPAGRAVLSPDPTVWRLSRVARFEAAHFSAGTLRKTPVQ